MKTSLKTLMTIILFVIFSNINAQDFFQSIKDGNRISVEQFIQEEPKLIDSIVKWDCTPLIFASYWGKDTIVELLIKHGADMYKIAHENGRVPLHLAAMKNNVAVVQVFINHGMDVNVKDADNKTALIYAIEKNHKETLELLLQNNAKLPEDPELMNLCLHSAVLFDLQDIGDGLQENGASLLGIDKYGRTLLHNAIIGNNSDWFNLMIEKHEIVNAVDSFMRTPLHYSVELNQIENTKALVQHGADINRIDNTNRTPLNIAMDFDYLESTTFLENNGGVLSDSQLINIGGEENTNSEIKVTYIANMGVMISSASKTVLIDAIFNESYYNYPTTPKNIVNKLDNLKAPYDSIDLILVTHSDGDHFSAPMVADYLSKNKSVKVVCNNNTASAIKDTMDSSIDSTRVVGITPDLCMSTDTLVNDMEVKVLRLRHSGRGDENDNLGFLIEMDGIKIFHQGDAGGNVKKGLAIDRIQEYDSIGIAAMGIDLAILNRGSVSYDKAPGLTIIKTIMKPKYIIVAHFSDYNKQGEWERVDNTIRNHADELPNITDFKWQMQEVIIQKGN